MSAPQFDLLTKQEAADYLHLTVRKITRLLSERRLAKYKLGGQVRIDRRDLDAYLERNRVEAER